MKILNDDLLLRPDHQVSTLAHHLYPLLDKLLLAIFIFIIFLAIAFIVTGIFRGIVKRNNTVVVLTLGRLIRNTIIILGVVFGLTGAGFNLTGLIASIGLWALAVGYGMQYIFANIGAGFLLMISGEVAKGQRVSVYGAQGVIVKMNLRYVTLQDEGKQFIIPNNLFLTYPVTIFDESEPSK